ncbi:MAG: type II toxin-antitoxin system HipA family toxin [Bacteroidales bacterium]|nr:type II toxin-antitoxin system HipA family toxin [Bacteroidales bacterium]
MKNIKLVEVHVHNQLVGKLAQTENGSCAFEYDANFIQNGFSISPFELPLKNGVFLAKQSPFNGNFGVFDDCLPDGWGMLILDRYLQKLGIQVRTLSILDRLSLVGSSGRGALEFRPDQSVQSQSDFYDFEYFSVESQKILHTKDYTGEAIESLYMQGGSPGGARPKVFVTIDEKEWLVKFRATNDPEDVGITEYNYSKLAKQCGIEMPNTRLIENKFFAVERFDREPKGKIHLASVAGLLLADYKIPCLDYLAIFQLCHALTHNMQEMWKLYRLMVFNFLIENKDDHAKNFSFMFKNNEWILAPAYDILPSDGLNGYHTSSINNKILPVKEDIFIVAEKVGLDRNNAIRIFNEMNSLINS